MAASEAASRQRTIDGEPIDHPKTRKSYIREYKLEVVSFYREHNLYQTAKRFSLNTKTVGCWTLSFSRMESSGSLPTLIILNCLLCNSHWIVTCVIIGRGPNNCIVYKRTSLLGA